MGKLTVVGIRNKPLEIVKPLGTWESAFAIDGCYLSAQGRVEMDSGRLCRVQALKVYFRAEFGQLVDKRGRIVQVNLDTFQERVLDNLKENIADFLVDENQTITYLTSGGELIQENVENNSIPRTSVNLKTDTTTGGYFSSLCQVSPSLFVGSHYAAHPSHKNTLLLTDLTSKLIKASLSIDTSSNYNGNTRLTKTPSR